MSKRKIEFTVHGVPRPKGDSKAYVVTDARGKPRKAPNGRFILRVNSHTKHSKKWQNKISAAARMAFDATFDARIGPPLLSGAIRVSAVYQFQRPKSHFVGGDRERGTLKAIVPDDHQHLQNPDRDKLDRTLGDALQDKVKKKPGENAVIVDDNQIVEGASWKEWICESSRMHVTVEEI